MDFTIIKTQILNSKRTFRTPFKVSSMCFSPHNDLIALGSKAGDVMLKRTSWKMIWKTNVSMVPAVGIECKSESPVTAMHFSPDGRFLAAATNKGILHLIDVETGKIRYSVKASSESIIKLQWDRVRDKSFSNNKPEVVVRSSKSSKIVDAALSLSHARPDINRESIGFVYHRLDEDGSAFKHDETQKENLERTLISDECFKESLRNTILLATLETFIPKIVVLVAGVFPFMVIDVDDVIKEFKQDCIMGYDSAHYSSAFNGVSFIVTTMGPYLDCKHDKQAPPVIDANRPGQAVQTLLFTVKLDLERPLWDAALRYLRLLYAYNLYSISLDTTKRNWSNQVAILHSLFDTKTKAVKIGDVLLEMLLSGSTDAAGEAFLERGLGTDGLEGIKGFASKHLPEVCRLARGQLASAARNLCFQKCEFQSAIDKYQKKIQVRDDDNFLYEEETPAYFFQPNVWLDTLEDKINVLDLKTRQLGIQCLTMTQELDHLTKWITLTKPFGKTVKVNSLMKIKRMDIAKILLYIVRNLFPDAQVAKDIERKLFHLKELIDEQKKKDEEENFDELKYLDELEVLAEAERKKLVQKFHSSFKFDALSPENDAVALKLNQEDRENVENEPEVLSEATALGEGNQQPTFDLDRVGSFFENELSEKALEVLPKCDEIFDDVIKNRGSRMNSPEIQKIGIKRALTELADLLLTPDKANCDKSGSPIKPKVLFVHELNSEHGHQGYNDIKISDVTPSFFSQHNFNEIAGLGRAVQVSVIGQNKLSSFVIVPRIDVPETLETEISEHVVAMKRQYSFETHIEVQVDTTETQPSPVPEDAMDIDENELRIDVNVDPMQANYDTLTECCQIHPLRHGELVILGKFKSNQVDAGVLTRMMRSVSSYPHKTMEEKDVFAVNDPNDGKAEASIDTLVVHPTTQLTAFIHDEGAKITLADMKPEVFVATEDDDEGGETEKKTFREYQRRRERYREDNGILNVNDVQYDVLVQEAMDSGRNLTDSVEPEDDDDDDE